MSIGGVGQYQYIPSATGTSGGLSGSSSASGVGGSSAADEFLKWARMTPAERMRADILSSMGLTEDQVAALPPDQRKAVEDKVREMIEEKIKQGEKKPGQLVDQKV